jgi:hypothetical protein
MQPNPEVLAKIGKNCGVDVNALQQKLTNVMTLVMTASTQEEKQKILASEENQKKLVDLINEFNKLTPEKMKCASDQDASLKPMLCMGSNVVSQQLSSMPDFDYESAIKFIEKSRSELRGLVNNLYNNVVQAQSSCGGNTELLKRNRNFVSQVSSLLVDENTLKQMCPKSTSESCPVCPSVLGESSNVTDNTTFRIVAGIALFLLIVVIYLLSRSSE